MIKITTELLLANVYLFSFKQEERPMRWPGTHSNRDAVAFPMENIWKCRLQVTRLTGVG